VERARRLLHQYNGELAYRSILLEQLRDRQIDVDLADPQAVAENLADEYQEAHAALWSLFEPKDWQQKPPRPAKAAYSNLAGQIRDGVKGRSAAVGENEKLLKAALVEIEQAFSAGESSDAVLFEAKRLQGVIQYHRGMEERLRATVARSDAETHRRHLAALASDAIQWSSSRELSRESGIDGQIERLGEEIAKGQTQLSRDEKELAALDANIKDVEARMAAAQSRADQARAALEKLQRDGVDFSDPDGGETFARQVGEHDLTYREAIRQAQSLEAGDLPKAEIDASGDFLRGKYLEGGSSANVTVQPGLAHHRRERAVLAAKIDRQKQAVEDLRSDVTRLEGIRAAHVTAQDDALRRTNEAQPLAAEAYEELNRIESEAAAAEDAAIKFFDSAIRAFQEAASAVDAWVSTARERTQNLSHEAKERSAGSAREDDEWLGGHISAQVADTRLAKAWTYYERLLAASQNAAVLTAVSKTVKLTEADPSAERSKAEDARQKGVEEVTKAMEVLEKAHRRADKHWTITAQAAGTVYLLALFGQTDYAKDAIDAYRTALKNPDVEKRAETLVARLKRLESR
jgi:hypothetical protein